MRLKNISVQKIIILICLGISGKYKYKRWLNKLEHVRLKFSVGVTLLCKLVHECVYVSE